MWVYAFGSVVRGELSPTSDLDVLLIGENWEVESAPTWAQCYSKKQLVDIFRQGDLFAYHLYSESSLIYSTDGTDIIKEIDFPAPYNNWKSDLRRFTAVAQHAVESLSSRPCSIFHKGLLYMACRDIAMIYAHVEMGKDDFSKESPYHIGIPFPISIDIYRGWNFCRLASTRGLWLEGIDAPVDRQCLGSILEWSRHLTNWGENRDK